MQIRGLAGSILLLTAAFCRPVFSQTASDDVRAEIRELRQAVGDLKRELESSRAESRELRRDLDAMRAELASARTADSPGASPPSVSPPQPSPDDFALLDAKVTEHDQTKVESGSKYRVRLSGMALINVMSTRGSVDNLDAPFKAMDRAAGESGGTFGATARQSFMKLELFGPRVAGAATRGEVSFDFFGGFPYSYESTTEGLMRLRTASFTFDWPKTTVLIGQEAPFFSPLSPTSLATVGYPALSGTGNLWVWTPQARVERRFDISDTSKFIVQGGILDPLTWEYPSNTYYRLPLAGERSRVPAFASRIGWQRTTGDRQASIGAGGYYSRQDWKYGRMVDGWAGTADWDVPLGRWFGLSGEFYRGRSIGGLGNGQAGSVLMPRPTGNAAYTVYDVIPLNSAGGWAQLKYKPVERVEFNAAFGQDRSWAQGHRWFRPEDYYNGGGATRNASGFVNIIYSLRSNLLLSVEYRRLWTTTFGGSRFTADHVNLGGGVVF